MKVNLKNFHRLVRRVALLSVTSILASPSFANPLLSGGETTVFSAHAGAFSFNAANMKSRRKGDFLIGNDFFEDPWVIAPATTDLRDGLGPLFNVSACQSCHFNDGRGHAPINAKDDIDSLLFRLSELQESTDDNSPNKLYGGQLQNRGIPGVPPEVSISFTYTPKLVTFADGHQVELREPTYHFNNWNYGIPGDSAVVSARVAPPMIGLGLLEAIPQADLEANSDPEDTNNDGISGRANYAVDKETGKTVIGRFGWKAGQPTVHQQSAGAFNGDIGLTSALFPEEGCTEIQTECLKAPNGADNEGVEVGAKVLEFVSHYSRNLAVPARRNLESETVTQGYRLFNEAGCQSCHVEKWQTAEQGKDRIEQSNQTIYPYTDLLLHDMGEALADRTVSGAPVSNEVIVEELASGREWRTPPLWGIGLSKVVNKEATFLHDGRARDLLEAVLWHDGEAEKSRNMVMTFDKEKREALIAFLNSL